ncbi:MAG TPA: LLM class flavin-dependent oxidoreductase [Thermomicrobiales bacterium]|nr:LLM class flavin-dependent oxidoreductase [Thermomicrobiales bacterium]
MKIGLILPLAESERGAAPSWEDLKERAQQAEQLGLDSIWVYDHLLHRFPGKDTVGFWEAWTMLTALAAATERVEIGTTVLCAGFRNPALLAKMATTLDEVSGGRLILGLGAGWHEPEFVAFDVPFDRRVARFEEALRIIRPLLRTGEVDVEGTWHSAPDCEVRPRGPRADGPPILIGSFGPRMHRLTARYGDQWTIDWLGDAGRVRAEVGKVHAACREEGRDPASLVITGGVTVGYRDLGELPAWMETPGSFLTGEARELGVQLAAYAGLGVHHLLTNLYPFNEAALARYGQAVEVAKQVTAQEPDGVPGS